MPDVNAFFDTNIVLYALSKDLQRKQQVAELLNDGCTLSTQVLAESANVMRRKFGCGMAEIESFHDALLNAFIGCNASSPRPLGGRCRWPDAIAFRFMTA